MNFLLASLGQRRLILTLVVSLSILGLVAWQSMIRQEDPLFPYRYGDIFVPYPGADPDQVERLVLNPLEEELAQVPNLKEIIGTARLGYARVTIGMQQHVYDTEAVWDRIRVAVAAAEQQFPDSVGAAEVRDRQMDAHSIVLAISGSEDLLALRRAAEKLRRELFQLKAISRIDMLGDPGQQVTVTWDDAVAETTGLGPAALAEQLAARNQTLAAGALRIGSRSVVLDPETEFRDLDALRQTPIRTATGASVPLGELASVSLTPAVPVTELIRLDGQPAVALGVVIPRNELNAVAFGETFRDHVNSLRGNYEPLEIREIFFQPHWVEKRLGELNTSLLIGVVIVASVLFMAMGLRLGLTVALIVPLVTLASLAVYAMGGGVLHQMSVSGMVIALGMLVDNAIVMTENIQWHRDRGIAADEAASRSARELAGPLLAATGTTLAAFLPLLLAPGDTADFTRGIPIMVMLTLVISYIYALFVTPVLAASLLKPRRNQRPDPVMTRGEQVGQWAIRRPGRTLGLALLVLVVAVAFMGALERDFFPSTDRNQLVVDMQFPEGTHIDHTDQAASALAADLKARPGVQQVYQFTGFSGPRFYYNLAQQPRQPHLARLVVIADNVDHIEPLMTWISGTAAERFPNTRVIPRRLGQGPPVNAPVEIRVFGENSGPLRQATEAVLAVVRADPGSRNARHTLGEGLAQLKVSVLDERAAEYGLDREQIAQALAAVSRGWQVSTWRNEREPMPLFIRSPEGERFPPHALEGLRLATPDGGSVPLGSVATISTQWQPAVIQHRDLARMTQVLSEVTETETYVAVLERIGPQLADLALPEGTSYRIGGTAETAGNANTALFQTLPIGGLLLIIFLLLQFNSFRMLAMVLVTIPLAAAGVIPGLWLAGQPFSFTAMLGIVALVGIVVNNAIVLIDRINRNRAEGEALDQAIAEAVGRRARPILLTTATTMAGMLPLTFTQSTLWPPMAWAIISGLLASTLLTLVVVPALYRVAFGREAA